MMPMLEMTFVKLKAFECIHNPLDVSLRKWQAPSGNMVKINTDAAISKDQREFGVGIIIGASLMLSNFESYLWFH